MGTGWWGSGLGGGGRGGEEGTGIILQDGRWMIFRSDPHWTEN